MAKDIKIKQPKKDIKIFDKAVVGTAKIRKNIRKTKDEITNNKEESNSEKNYAINKISDSSKNIVNLGADISKKILIKKRINTKKNNENKNNIININDLKSNYNASINTNNSIENYNNVAKRNITFSRKKANEKIINDIPSSNFIINKEKNNLIKTKTYKNEINIKNSKTLKNKSIKTYQNLQYNLDKQVLNKPTTIQKARKLINSKLSKDIDNSKKIVKSITTILRNILQSSKALLYFLIAGGSLSFVVIIIICMIGLICNSTFGIFLSGEVKDGSMSLKQATMEINKEFSQRLSEEQNKHTYDEFDINSNRATWKDVIAIYATKVGGADDKKQVVTLDEEKFEILKKVFWDMNKIESKIEVIKETHTEKDKKGNDKIVVTTKRILHITITSKSTNEMADKYHFNKRQRKDLEELLSDRYAGLWQIVLTGGSGGSSAIVDVAISQLGNVGGQPYWSWYGFQSRVSWCACFVSWCANECGYIDSGTIPKFAACQNEGISWFKACGLWQERGYMPSPGDIIFFDWEHDGHSDHVGIVESCDGSVVYTIEGNSNDSCREKQYEINSLDIVGYGTPMY